MCDPKTIRKIDLNCDMGESFGPYHYGADKELMPFISSANIACGFHAGDPGVMRETVELAAEYGVRIGAHIGFPDRLGFGRRKLDVNAREVYEYTLYQIGALDGFLKSTGLSMSHIKLHGALYMMASERDDLANATVKAVSAYNSNLEIYALPGSELAISGKTANLQIRHEFFADRPYIENKVKMFGWTLEEIGTPTDIAERTVRLLQREVVNSDSPVDTICVHSDTPGAPMITKCISDKLVNAGWLIKGDE
ncbi:5-oxoprolinase subunit PxpA [Bacillus canaveralius]|nr:5-oxoprolinase subunit PxpA [Bacillus canaveralius]